MKPWLILFAILSVSFSSRADGPTAAERGFQNLTTKPYMDVTMTPDLFASLWRSWEEPFRTRAEKADAKTQRAMTMERYGLVEAPYENHGAPMGYVVDAQGQWRTNCLICHGGSLLGQSIPGLPNHAFDLATLEEDTKLTWAIMSGKPVPARPINFGKWISDTRGTTNAFFLSALGVAIRDLAMNFIETPVDFGAMKGADLDAPPWWNVKGKSHIYSDGYAERDPRALMQFAVASSESGDTVKSWLGDFEDILTWIEQTKPPRYPQPVDLALAKQGQAVFEKTCARCHGTYGADATGDQYPERTVKLAVIGTDPERLTGLTKEFRSYYARGWLGRDGAAATVVDPVGYVAPRLRGIWASAPYFHNGSVPNLYSVLKSSARPSVWKTSDLAGYDFNKLGLVIEVDEKVPEGLAAFERRRYYDTHHVSQSNSGHEFGDELTEPERASILEYLKTL